MKNETKETIEIDGKKITFEIYESKNLKSIKIQGDIELITNKECFDKMLKLLGQTKEEGKIMKDHPYGWSLFFSKI